MKFLRRSYMGLVLLFLYAPLLVMLVYSFNASPLRGKWGGFSLKWYEALFHNPNIMRALLNTLTIATLATIISVVVGTISAIGIYGMGKKGRALMLNATYIPIVSPDIVTGVSFMILFVFLRIPLGYFTMLLAHVAFNIPYVIYSVLPRLQQMDKSIYEAALDLGAGPGYALRSVILPEIMPGIISGAILAFTLSIDDFVISFFTTSGVQNLSIYIYSSTRRGIDPSVYAIMTLMFVAVLTLLIINSLRGAKEQRKPHRASSFRSVS